MDHFLEICVVASASGGLAHGLDGLVLHRSTIRRFERRALATGLLGRESLFVAATA